MFQLVLITRFIYPQVFVCRWTVQSVISFQGADEEVNNSRNENHFIELPEMGVAGHKPVIMLQRSRVDYCVSQIFVKLCWISYIIIESQNCTLPQKE